MLQQITWTQFLVVLLTITVLYYIIYFIKFHWHRWMEKFHSKTEVYESELFQDNTEKQDNDSSELEELELLVNSIKQDILVEAGTDATKEFLLEKITAKVANYGGVRLPAYRYALKNFIIQHAKTLCGVEIEEEVLEDLWKNLPR